ncbi:hypothetical protein [Rhodococcus jostii]|uniref:Uncharacterized protein n=1 Tax=Rhodococcus jostii TaxID=132919 RepID=A0ABU4CTD9_RHOJO|nr:hypothetical protein [Rhodococcus jostii]MDV6286830.1 hypothetical protein [Rhodococcus jostii]
MSSLVTWWPPNVRKIGTTRAHGAANRRAAHHGTVINPNSTTNKAGTAQLTQ